VDQVELQVILLLLDLLAQLVLEVVVEAAVALDYVPIQSGVVMVDLVVLVEVQVDHRVMLEEEVI
jgi:hypothetical protein